MSSRPRGSRAVRARSHIGRNEHRAATAAAVTRGNDLFSGPVSRVALGGLGTSGGAVQLGPGSAPVELPGRRPPLPPHQADAAWAARAPWPRRLTLAVGPAGSPHCLPPSWAACAAATSRVAVAWRTSCATCTPSSTRASPQGRLCPLHRPPSRTGLTRHRAGRPLPQDGHQEPERPGADPQSHRRPQAPRADRRRRPAGLGHDGRGVL
jgi:hypothetical protein